MLKEALYVIFVTFAKGLISMFYILIKINEKRGTEWLLNILNKYINAHNLDILLVYPHERSIYQNTPS